MEVFFVIGALFIIGAVVKGLSGSSSTAPIDLNARPFQSSKSIPILIGSFKATQFIGKDEHLFDCSMEYDESENTMIILIDGRTFMTKMKLGKLSRNYFIAIIDKAIDWSKKAADAGLNADKPISSIHTDVSFVFNNQVYYANDSKISFYFYNDSEDITGSKMYLVAGKYDVGGVLIPPSIIWIRNSEFENIKSILTDETIQSVLTKLAEKSRIQDEILT